LSFIYYEKKTFNSAQTQILFDILKSRNIPDTLLKAVVDIYTQNKILVILSQLSRLAEINKGVCPGCPLLPTLFNVLR